MAMKGQISIRYYNVEFYNVPNGDVMYHIENQPLRKLKESDRDLIGWMMEAISERYPKAFDRLCELYTVRSRNRLFYEFSIVKRFARCNFGELDEYCFDIDRRGNFCFEEVRCPLRGECLDEGIICKPEPNTNLTQREMDIFRLIVDGFDGYEIAQELSLSLPTVNNHRENIKRKIGVRTVAQMVAFWNNNKFK